MHTAPIWRASADRDGNWAVTGSDDKTVRVWSLADGALVRTIRLPAGPGYVGKVYAVAISPDGALIAAGGWTRWTNTDQQEQIYLFDRATGTLVPRIEGLPKPMRHLVFSPDGSRLAALLGAGAGLRVYARESGWNEVARDEQYDSDSYGADFAPDGRLATTSLDGRIRLYAAGLRDTVRPVASLKAPGGELAYGIAFSPPDGARLAAGYHDSTNLDLLNGNSLAPLTGPDLRGISGGNLMTVAWSRDGGTLFAGGQYYQPQLGSRPVLAWEASGARHSLPAGDNTVMSLVGLRGGDLLVASQDPWLARVGPDGTRRWAHGPPQVDFRNQHDRLTVSRDGTRVGFGYEASADRQRCLMSARRGASASARLAG